MPESEILDVLDEVFVAGVDRELLEDLDEDEAEDELDGQVSLLGHELQLGPGQAQLAEIFFNEVLVRWNYLKGFHFLHEATKSFLSS